MGEEVAELFLLGPQVFLGIFGGRNFAGHALGYTNAGVFERGNFVRIVREQPNPADAERVQNLGGHAKFSLVGFETEALVGFDGVEATVLQGIGLEFCHEADTATFLLLVDQDARTLGGDHGERHLELLPAITAQRTKDIAGQALGVNAHERRTRLHVAHDQRHGLFGLHFCAVGNASREAMNQEMSPARGEIGGGNLFYARRTHTFII